MYPFKMMLYVFFFVLGFAFNMEFKTEKPSIKAEYAMSTDIDIGIAEPQKITETNVVEITDENEIATHVRLKTLTVIADDLSIRDVYLDINEYEKEVGSLETIDVKLAYLDVPNIEIKKIGEVLKIC